jgi:hypothetical protein
MDNPGRWQRVAFQRSSEMKLGAPAFPVPKLETLSLVSEFGSAHRSLTLSPRHSQLSRQVVEEDFGCLKIEGVKTFGEPAV